MTAEGARRKATYQDVLNAPEHLVAEVVGGELHTHPRPAIPHALAASVLGSELGTLFHRARGGPGGWILLDEPELHLREDIVVPDLAGWRRERLPAVPNAAFISLAPDWLCEVLSPSTVRFDRVAKLGVYTREHVRHVWFVDPIARTLEVLRFDQGAYRIAATFGGDEVVRAEPFDAIELELSALWLKIEDDAR